MWEKADGGVVAGPRRGLTPGIVIGRAGLAEGQSALTGRGRGDARSVLRMAGERWRYTRNKMRTHQSRAGRTIVSNESAVSHRLLQVTTCHPIHPFGRVAWAADGHKLSEDWLMGLQGCMRMMEFTCIGRSPSDPGELELAHPGKHDEKSSSQAGRLVP